MKRPIHCWLTELKEPFRTQALENAKNIDALHINHHSALDYAFDWAQTKQGHDYWRVVYEDLKDFGMASQFLVFNHSRPVNEGLTSW